MARRAGMSHNSVRKYLGLLTPTLLSNEEPDNKELADKAYGIDSVAHDVCRLQQLIEHFGYAQEELGKTGVTRQLLWQEYLQQHPDGYVWVLSGRMPISHLNKWKSVGCQVDFMCFL